MFEIDITSAGNPGTHILRKVNVNAEDSYVYFKNEDIPLEINNGGSYIYSEGSGSIVGLEDDSLVYTRIDLPTVVSIVDDADVLISFTGSSNGDITLNQPVVYDNILNIATTTPTNQAVKYYTAQTPLAGLISGNTYFLRKDRKSVV